MSAPLRFGQVTVRSRLWLGTGRFPDHETAHAALAASGADVVTVALRRLPWDAAAGRPDASSSILAAVPDGAAVLPNTAGCRTAGEAVATARLAREMGLPAWVKLEVIDDPRWLMPDPVATLAAAETLAAEGFAVLPYIQPDPALARRLEAAGCAAVMPLGAPIGSGWGLPDPRRLLMVLEAVSVPVVVDAGLGAPSDAALAMELGAAACLVNTAVAQAGDPVAMARAFALGVEAGRRARLAGRIPRREAAQASSPGAGAPQVVA